MADNIWVLTPIVIPFGNNALVRRVNRLIFAAQYRLALRLLKFHVPYLFVFSPNWAPYTQAIRRRKMIYYCVDEHSSFSGVDSGQFAAWDGTLTRRADHVFCSADWLFRKKLSENPSTHYMPHGVNWGLFSRAVKQDDPGEDSGLKDLPRPILLFFGHVSYDWVDTALIKFVASERPSWQIALVGRSSIAQSEFSGISNVHVLGERNYEDLPLTCKYASIGIIPFVSTELTKACNPLKLYEYLAAGLPVVSTDIPEVRKYQEMVLIGRTPMQFLAACDEALTIDRATWSPRASAAVRDHDWDRRVEHIYSLIAA